MLLGDSSEGDLINRLRSLRFLLLNKTCNYVVLVVWFRFSA